MWLIELNHLVSVTILPSSWSVEAFYFASSLPDGIKLRPILVAFFIFSIPFLFNYILLSLLYAIENWLAKSDQISPTYSYVILFLGSTISFLWDSINFIKSATYVHIFFAPSLTLHVYSAADAFLEVTLVNRHQLVFHYWRARSIFFKARKTLLPCGRKNPCQTPYSCIALVWSIFLRCDNDPLMFIWQMILVYIVSQIPQARSSHTIGLISSHMMVSLKDYRSSALTLRSSALLINWRGTSMRSRSARSGRRCLISWSFFRIMWA